MSFPSLNLGIEGLEFDMNSGEDETEEHAGNGIDPQQPYDYDDDYDGGDIVHNASGSGGRDFLSCPNEDSNLEPYEGMEFDSEQAARIFYNSYARRIGFSTRVSVYQRSRRDGSIICRQVVCSREGFRREGSENKSKRQRTVTRVGCKAQLTVKKQTFGKWSVTKLVKQHNHELVPPDKVHCLRSHRHVSGPARSLIDTLQAAGMGPSGVMTVLIKESGGISNVGFTKVDCQNYMNNSRMRTLGSGIQFLLDYFKQKQAADPDFFFSVQGDTENASGNVFWAEANSRRNYKYFGDTVTFDTTYRTNRYRVPFAPFTGINHHGQPILFGCALLLKETESSFAWLFQTWLSAMSNHHPSSITTDQDRIIRSAVALVFPATRHRFCKWNILREAQERLSHIYLMFPTFEAELQKCINLTKSIEEFESCWESLLERYKVFDNEWLRFMYNAKQQWVPVYLRDTFFSEMCITQSDDSINSFFDGYINATTNANVFIKQYEKAIASRYEREIKADYDTINSPPVLKTPSPMEKQAANFYTKHAFIKFQEQLVETLANPTTVMNDSGSEIMYRVAKFGENQNSHSVRFSVFEKKANCSCQMFEFSGILCRHVLAVFRVANVLTFPSRYILRRWTRSARSGVLLDEDNVGLPSIYQESYDARYDNLCREAIKFVEEGSDSELVYNVAVNVLREAAKKVDYAKKNVKVLVSCSLADGSDQETNANTNGVDHVPSSSMDQDKKLRELNSQVESASQRFEAYRGKLVEVLRGMEEEKLKISVKIRNIRLNRKT